MDDGLSSWRALQAPRPLYEATTTDNTCGFIQIARAKIPGDRADGRRPRTEESPLAVADATEGEEVGGIMNGVSAAGAGARRKSDLCFRLPLRAEGLVDKQSMDKV